MPRGAWKRAVTRGGEGGAVVVGLCDDEAGPRAVRTRARRVARVWVRRAAV